MSKPHATEELQKVKVQDGHNGLWKFIAKWDFSIEKLVQAGGDAELDQDYLYVIFRDSFVSRPEVKDHQATVNRSLLESRVHTYTRMYHAAKATLETMRLKYQEMS